MNFVKCLFVFYNIIIITAPFFMIHPKMLLCFFVYNIIVFYHSVFVIFLILESVFIVYMALMSNLNLK